ncbi:MAG: M48 family metallopeptidase [Candidatus Omnitrophota bacterium]|nr:M48 family metallopeptidase [Candidatus Omnitrophota bacterium]MDZ4241456.1 M48 family metallopeptidase [Candidatus Omnitrophota bacterium]
MHREFAARFLSALILAVSVTGCASLGSYNAATQRREFIFIPTDYEVSMGQDVHRQIMEQYKPSDNKAQAARLERIGQKLAQVSDRQDYEYHFFLVDSKDLNAFTTPGGNIYMHTGLMDRMKSDDEVAAVLAHEIGHCAARHTVKKFQAAVGYDLISGIILNQVTKQEQTRQIAALGTGAVMNLVFSSYSRKDEYEADRLGLKYMSLAGYDMDGMVKTFEILNQESKGPEVPLLLRSHPYLEDRIAAVKKEQERIRTEGL